VLLPTGRERDASSHLGSGPRQSTTLGAVEYSVRSDSFRKKIILGTCCLVLWLLVVKVLGDLFHEQIMRASEWVKYVVYWSFLLPFVYVVGVLWDAVKGQQEQTRVSQLLKKLRASQYIRKH